MIRFDPARIDHTRPIGTLLQHDFDRLSDRELFGIKAFRQRVAKFGLEVVEDEGGIANLDAVIVDIRYFLFRRFARIALHDFRKLYSRQFHIGHSFENKGPCFSKSKCRSKFIKFNHSHTPQTTNLPNIGPARKRTEMNFSQTANLILISRRSRSR